MMQDKKVMVIGEKHTFLTRVVEKKINEGGIKCVFVPWKINDINANWEDTVLVVMYMEEDARPNSDILTFLIDKLSDTGDLMIPVGTKNDIAYIIDNVPGELIHKSFVRPVNNDDLLKAIKEFVEKFNAGEIKKSILVVDDDPGYLGIVREWLKGPYKVSLVSSGLQALKWLGKNKVDLILLDYEMPVTSGPHVLEMLRADPETADIPVMFLTGKGDKESVMKVLSLKPEGYLLKTIDRAELLKNLEDFFNK